jgi:uracil-DNA glycosylase family 4
MSDTLQLDKRQRAMLAEMGVRVWTPISEAKPLRENDVNSAATKVVQTASNLDWPNLRKAVANCQACGLCTSRRNTVFGTGSYVSNSDVNNEAQHVDWLIVGEAPGENEDAEGEPFVGQAGQLLDNMLRAMQLSRTGEPSSATKPVQSIFITNVLKCRPPGNRNPAPEEVAQCMPYLQQQIDLLQPKIILAMGRFAAQALLRDSIDKVEAIPLGKLRGQVHRSGNTPVVVTYHPAYVLRNLPEKAKLWADACLAMATLNQG